MDFRYKILYLCLSLLLCSCFTGVESTPKITYSDVKREHIVVSGEQRFMSDVEPEPPSKWVPGKKFYVTDPKILLVLSADMPIDSVALVGSDIVFKGIDSLPTLTGEEMAIIDFVSPASSSLLRYKTQIPYSEIGSKAFLDIPYAIDMDLVDDVSSKLKGKTYFITTPLWYNALDGKAVNGLRHVAVCVDDVVPGTDSYPIKVIFHQPGSDRKYAVFMTVGHRRTSTRNFDTLFAFDDPRLKYPNITEEDWQLIINSRVRIGMSKDECRLALGAPKVSGQRPTTAGMVEYWSYADGVYLIFEEGLLSSFRH